eukprot:jgi/Tetstr1/445793/TSEL_033439.t1
MAVGMRMPYQQLKQHVAAGPFGMRNECLRCLVGKYAPASGPAAVRAMSEVASMYLQGCMPGWFNRLFASVRLVAPVKKLGECGVPDVRPMAVGDAERRAAERAVVDDMKAEAYVSTLAPSQLGVGISAGDFVPIHGVRLCHRREAWLTHALRHQAWAMLKHCMQHMAGYWFRNCLPSEVEAFAEAAVDATVLTAIERVSGAFLDPSTYGFGTTTVVADFLAEFLHDPDPINGSRGGYFDRGCSGHGAQHALAPHSIESVLGRCSFNAASSARRYDHFLNDARGSASCAAAVREAWGRLHAATPGHLGDAYARVMKREAEARTGADDA